MELKTFVTILTGTAAGLTHELYESETYLSIILTFMCMLPNLLLQLYLQLLFTNKVKFVTSSFPTQLCNLLLSLIKTGFMLMISCY
jgi:hypothetical protein